MSTPRGIRNNNPLNIRLGASKWQGLSPAGTDPDFCTFTGPEYGIRAAAKLIQTYGEKYGLHSLREIINRWAPPSENDTTSYMTAVSIWSGINADDPVDASDYQSMYNLLRAMTRMENGPPPEDIEPYWYQPEIWEKGLRMAGVIPTKKLVDSRTIRGTATAAVAGTTALGSLLDVFGLPPEVTAMLPTALAGMNDQTVAIISIGVGIAGAIYAAWSRRDDAKWGRL